MIVLWRVTTRCNYACGFCAYDRRLGGPRHDVTAETALRFGSLLATWAQAREERVMLSWLGGEPLLWRPLHEVSTHLARAGLAISATTNGSTLGRTDIRAALLRDFAELTISIDGPDAVHDRLRGRAGVQALAAERGAAPLRLRANVVLMRDTISTFDALCNDLADWGFDEITFNQLGGRDRPAFFPPQRLRPHDIATLTQALPRLRRALADRGVVLRGDGRYLERLRASAVGTSLPVDDCAPGARFLFVDEHDIVSPCSFSGAHYGVPIASLRTPADLDALPLRFAAARRRNRLADCDDCPSTQTFAKFAAA